MAPASELMGKYHWCTETLDVVRNPMLGTSITC